MQSDFTMSHHWLSHSMNINIEKNHNNLLGVINTIAKYYFNFNRKHFKAAVDALVHSQDIYAEAKNKADAELDNIQSAYYDCLCYTKCQCSNLKDSYPNVVKKEKYMPKCCANKCADALVKINEVSKATSLSWAWYVKFIHNKHWWHQALQMCRHTCKNRQSWQTSTSFCTFHYLLWHMTQ